MSNLDSFPTIRVSQIRDLLVAFARLDLPPCRRSSVMLLSEPGIGKTQSVHAAAKICGAQVVTLVASLLDRLDLAGIPYVEQVDALPGSVEVADSTGKVKRITLTKWAGNELVSSLSKEHNPNGQPVFLYLNEVNAAPESVMSVLYRIVNSGERRIGEFTLRDNVMAIGDGNPESCHSAGRDMHEAFKRRFAIFRVGFNLQEWIGWAQAGGSDMEEIPCRIPDKVGASAVGIDGRILAFFGLTQNARHCSDFDPAKRERWQFANPAGWEKLSHHLPALEYLGQDFTLAFVSAFIGVEAGCDFTAFLRNADKIEGIERVLKNPKTAQLPKHAETIMLLGGIAVNRAVANPDENLVATTDLAFRMIEGANVEVSCEDFGAMMLISMFRHPVLSKRITGNEVILKKVFASLGKAPHLKEAIYALKAA